MSISWLLCLVTDIKLFHYMLRGTFISEDKRGVIMLCVEKPGIFFFKYAILMKTLMKHYGKCELGLDIGSY